MLQQIDNYGLLAKMLFDLQMPSDATYGKYNMLCGTRSDLVAKLSPFSAIPALNAHRCFACDCGKQATHSLSTLQHRQLLMYLEL